MTAPMEIPSTETALADLVVTSSEVFLPDLKLDDGDALLGKTLDGRFRVEALLGKGAMGRVYRALQVPLNRPVALKVLDSNCGAGRDASFRQRFLVESALTARLSHPHTVRIFDYGCTADGIFYLAMEFLDGATLERVLARGPLNWRVALSIAQQMTRALREAHELGVVHRDLKPANIMLLHADDDTEHVKVLDFGLVKSFVEGHELEGRVITQQGALIGSPPYMAPEQAERNRADPRSDIYSVGVMLYEMLTGRVPYAGRLPLEIILQHLNSPVPALTTPRGFDDVPEELKDIVTRCLAKSPMDRFQTTDDLLSAFQDIPSGSGLPAGLTTGALPLVPASLTTGAAPPAPRHVKALTLLFGFVLALLAGVGVTTVFWRGPSAFRASPPELRSPAHAVVAPVAAPSAPQLTARERSPDQTVSALPAQALPAPAVPAPAVPEARPAPVAAAAPAPPPVEARPVEARPVEAPVTARRAPPRPQAGAGSRAPSRLAEGDGDDLLLQPALDPGPASPPEDELKRPSP
jgi:hypothetical protein